MIMFVYMRQLRQTQDILKATADDYNEPIYVRQYQGDFATLKRTLTLLDGSGNTSIPGTLTIATNSTIQYNATDKCIEFIVK